MYSSEDGSCVGSEPGLRKERLQAGLDLVVSSIIMAICLRSTLECPSLVGAILTNLTDAAWTLAIGLGVGI